MKWRWESHLAFRSSAIQASTLSQHTDEVRWWDGVISAAVADQKEVIDLAMRPHARSTPPTDREQPLPGIRRQARRRGSTGKKRGWRGWSFGGGTGRLLLIIRSQSTHSFDVNKPFQPPAHCWPSIFAPLVITTTERFFSFQTNALLLQLEPMKSLQNLWSRQWSEVDNQLAKCDIRSLEEGMGLKSRENRLHESRPILMLVLPRAKAFDGVQSLELTLSKPTDLALANGSEGDKI